jgi:uncharacterized protein YcfJ
MPFVISTVTALALTASPISNSVKDVTVPIDHVSPITQNVLTSNIAQKYCIFVEKINWDLSKGGRIMEEICEPRAVYNKVIVGYNVYYTYGGRTNMVTMKEPPGPSLILKTQ